MKSALRVLLVLTVLGATAAAQSPEGDVLSIYLVDVEGGGATLFVSPTGESMLMDTGNGGANADRDVSRIMAAAEDAARAQGFERMFALTTQTRDWFVEQGFQDGSLEDLPAPKQTLYNHARGAKVLVKALT